MIQPHEICGLGRSRDGQDIRIWTRDQHRPAMRPYRVTMPATRGAPRKIRTLYVGRGMQHTRYLRLPVESGAGAMFVWMFQESSVHQPSPTSDRQSRIRMSPTEGGRGNTPEKVGLRSCKMVKIIVSRIIWTGLCSHYLDHPTPLNRLGTAWRRP